MYLTYEQYQSLGGTLSEAVFSDCEMEAEMLVNWFTFDRLKNEQTYSEDVQKCVYMLIKYIALQSGLDGSGNVNTDGSIKVTRGGIASESNDGVSASYNVLSAQELMENAKSKIEEIIKMSLQGVVNSLGRKVLYRGLYPGE